MRFLFWIIFLPMLALAGAFAAVNTAPVTLRMWPLPYEMAVPAYAAVLGPFVLGVALASLWFWVAGLGLKLQRRRLARHDRELEDETRRLREALAAAERRAGTEAMPADEARRRLIAMGD